MPRFTAIREFLHSWLGRGISIFHRATSQMGSSGGLTLRYRIVLAVVVVTVGSVTFVELILLPGKLVRRTQNAGGASQAVASDGIAEGDASPFSVFFQTHDQRQRQTEIREKRAEDLLRHTQLEMGNACVAVEHSLAEVRDHCVETLGFGLNGSNSVREMPPIFQQILASEPTASQAWVDAVRGANHAESVIKDVHFLNQGIAERLASGTFLEEDDSAMKNAIAALEEANRCIDAARRDITHLDALRRGHVALERISQAEK